MTRQALVALAVAVALAACATATGSDPDAGGNVEPADSGPSIPDADTTPDADTCPGDPCSLAPQCGCIDQACDIDVEQLETGGTLCRDVSQPGTELGSCSDLSECAPGYVCLGGQCRQYCNDEVACVEGAHCSLQAVYEASPGVFEPIPGAVTCTKVCEPDQAVDNGCPANPQFGCRVNRADPDGVADSGDEFYRTDCSRATAAGGDGADCTTGGNTDCAAGYQCVVLNGTDNVCKQTCVWNRGATPGERLCDGGRTCTQFSDPFPIVGDVEYGWCQ